MREDVAPTAEQVEGQDAHDEPDVAPVMDICDVEGGDEDGDGR